MIPPMVVSSTASVRNCSRMSRRLRADGHPDADLAGPLGHRDEHDVHDADAADDERDRGDRAEQQRHDLGSARTTAQDLGEVAHREVDLAARTDAVALVQERRDLLLRLLEHLGALGLDHHGADRVGELAPEELALRGRERHDRSTSSWSCPCGDCPLRVEHADHA